ncbi:hypothetical protein P167DRAFT_547358 [Morchella conica CCBAS932]|uniref:Concanavalin A-like lectin/glucanase n=1 Tax=Morchella conica CCBAS932 TaxID=1392247 RepID=A0A3N4KI75_9PEZI|nr:hypothetical protein P167DRAFT_547358 [Morchella conica CCBAS932]
MKTSSSLLVLLSSFLLSSATLLVDYHGGDAASVLGNVELEGQELGCKILNGQAGNACFIKPEPDSATGKNSLHFKRDPHFRRAEVKALYTSANKAVVDKTYYIGYNFRLSKAYEDLVIFQWKKWDKTAEPQQNIPLYVFFNENLDLTIEYTIPGGTGSNREVVWTGPVSVGANTNHHLAFVINTANDGTGWAEFYLDGVQQNFNAAYGGGKRLKNVYLFTGDTSPKFGIYRGEAAAGADDGDKYCPANNIYTGETAPSGTDHIFNSWIYRVQISDSSLSEVAEAAGL